MICLFVVEAILYNKLLELGHFFVDLLGKRTVQILNPVYESKKLVFHLTDVVRPIFYPLDLFDYVFVFFDWEHYIILNQEN